MNAQSIVQVRHFVPLVGRRKGTRKEAVAFDVAITPIRLVDVPAAGMRHVGCITNPYGTATSHEIHEMDGALWTPILDSLKSPMPASEVRAFLEGTDGHFPLTDLARGFAHSPLVSNVAATAQGRPARLDREGFTASYDGSMAGVSGTEEFLERNLRIVGGRPFLRVPGPTVTRQILGAPGVYCATVHPMAMILYDGHVRIDGIQADWDRRIANGEIEPQHRREKPTLRGAEWLGITPVDDSDIAIGINQAVPSVMAHLGYTASKLGGEVRQRFAEAEARLRPTAAMASIGLVQGDDIEIAARALNAAATAVLAHCDRRTPGEKRVRTAVAYLSEVVLPRISDAMGRSVPSHDVDALEGLAP